MSMQSLPIKDGTGSIQYIAVESGSYGFVPIHQVTSSNAYPVFITASSSNPLPVTGTINVDVQVSDLITVTSSVANPVWVTGTLAVNTASYVTSSINNEYLYVTSSAANPVYASITNTLTVNTASNEVYVMNLEANAVYVRPMRSQNVTLTSPSSPGWDTSASGSFILAAENQSRKSLMIFNPGPNDLYVAMSTSGGATNGFVINDITQPPDFYSFILYPSGTFVGDNTNLNVHYGGFFISGSSNSTRVTVII